MKLFTNTKPVNTRLLLVFLVASVVSIAGYLLWSRQLYSIGYPLDDAWIHQTYARNLAASGDWYYLPGNRSAGSTSPLYTFLISVGYKIGINSYFWTFLLGWICLVGIATTATSIYYSSGLSSPKYYLIIGIFLLSEWHLVWAAVSGMETLLFAWLALLVMMVVLKRPVKWWFVGTLVGISVWVRPDGILLIGPVVFTLFLAMESWKNRFKALIIVGIVILCLIAVYTAFNYRLSGNFVPNTFTAKQTEYSELQSQPFLKRFIAQAQMMLMGGGLLLLPGFIYFIFLCVKKKMVVHLAWILWMLGYLFIFAWRLPVVYQHGRYAIPAMPIYFVTGWIGLCMLVQHLRQGNSTGRIFLKSWFGSIGFVSLIFWILGAGAFAQDVAIIQTEMVNSAKWIAQNTPRSALVATHDIGALGYYSERNLIDLAGLLSPEVIPIMRDESRLAAYMNMKGVDFLVVFPGWYPEITACLQLLHSTGEPFSLSAGGENMAVYKWTDPQLIGGKCQN